MTLKQVMAELKKLGTEQNRKVYRRHGAGDNMFGVSFGNLQKLGKQLKKNPELADELWMTGNFDAQSLACLIADPKVMTRAQLDGWTKLLEFSPAVDYLVKYVTVKHPDAKSLADKWMKSKKEYVIRCGYHTMANLVKEQDPYTVEEMRGFVDTIKANIHKAPNRGKEGMHNALIAIGGHPKLKAYAITAAKAMGPVDIDHGETNCKTPDPVEYIEKIHARAAKQKTAKAG